LVVVIVSAFTEWNVVKTRYNESQMQKSPYGEYIVLNKSDYDLAEDTVLLHGGWAKENAAGSAQYAIDKFSPRLIINLGTCGGFEGQVSAGDIILADKTVIYDIYEKMFDPIEAINEFTSEIDLSWISEAPKLNVKRGVLVSGDSDLDPESISKLQSEYSAIAGDWESGAIAHVCKLNKTPCLIIRGVSDIVSSHSGEAYEDLNIFISRTKDIMDTLLDSFPWWIRMFNNLPQ
jgi:adenosylhomocysteine nucleosidase